MLYFFEALWAVFLRVGPTFTAREPDVTAAAAVANPNIKERQSYMH